ncbi:hypothetical protein [Longimicrobium terrae]|uniref:Uncharacterized protein n=1 Tax=Longimicrobium terrae TaxID=1639882 RepID=A0A841H4K3_9BACT|nr:hypothetical protein [Longimicrobium terrae]MBB4638916.1 hypothetical protein [Longimicrobium terrae]MBB6073155.1 hypothetical protein [Longimicrobium terrae]NNC30159.1 hypothetical protein [Longimicrobium terrae]
MTIRLETPDATFRLTPEERARVRPDLDVDALEQLLAQVTSDVRPVLLQMHMAQQGEGVEGLRPMRMGDPALQPLLDEVWAPVWMAAGIEAIRREPRDFPGKELARQRLQDPSSPINRP